MKHIRLSLLTAGLLCCGISSVIAQSPLLKLWYDKPAKAWTDALPIGNGKLGAMVYGGVDTEHLQFNESTLWSGGPREYQREGASKYLPQIRQLLIEGKQDAAEALATEHFMGRKNNEDTYEAEKAAWTTQVLSNEAPAAINFQDVGWKEMEVPALQGWESIGYDGLDGSVWFRVSFEVPKTWAGKNLVLDLGRIRDRDVTYVNGQQVGTTDDMKSSRAYKVKGSLVKAGKNQIAVHVINYYDKGGFTGGSNSRKSLLVYPEGDSAKNNITLPTNWKYWVENDNPPAFPRYEADYQPFGDLWLQFPQGKSISNYHRELDLTNAVSKTTYTANGVQYTREYIASAPGGAVILHLTASKPGSLSFKAALSSPHRQSSTKRIDDKTLQLQLQVRNGALRGVSLLRVATNDGNVTTTDSTISIDKASDVILYLTAATNFKNYKDVSGDPEAISQEALKKVSATSFQELLNAHTKEYQHYFNRFSVSFGKSQRENLPTDERIRQFSNETDPQLLSLLMQYGRYLLISSSRPGSQAANLQGIWNPLLFPPWGSKYTTNINLEMNYWPAEILNLSECTEPLFRLIGETAEAGQNTAKAHYDAPGWVLHHNTDLWRGTAPINASNHGIWVTGAAWLCHHIWEHYLFTQDKAFLQANYPIMVKAANFYSSFLTKDPKSGKLISTPSNSPEHGGLVAGPTMDHQIIRNLYQDCMDAADVLETDKDFRQSWQQTYSSIAPNKIGKYGQLQEWMEDRDDTADKHRHVSHVWGVYPGTDISWDKTPEMMKAARQSLIYRGDDGTGWSLAWKINLWARFKDGDHAMKMVNNLLTVADYAEGHERGGVYRNLFDAHPPFQIDGNFGGASGIAEMLLQSQAGYLELLPALPSTLPEGTIKGICGRGGFVADFSWKNGKLETVSILSTSGNTCTLKYGRQTKTFATQKGKTYRFNGSLKQI